MGQEQYNKLKDKYGKDKLRIDVLEDRGIRTKVCFKQYNSECFFSGLVRDLKMLDKCETIHGDLRMKGKVEGTTMNQIKVITGCISINGTNLEYLHFLRRLGKDSSNLCGQAHGKLFEKYK